MGKKAVIALSIVIIVAVLIGSFLLIRKSITGRIVELGKCYESDKGIIYETKGNCWYQSRAKKYSVQYDSCINNSLRECYCDTKGKIKFEIVACSYGCKNGRCIKRQEFLVALNYSSNITCYPAAMCKINKTTIALIKDNNKTIHTVNLINTTFINSTISAVIQVDNFTENVLENKQYNFTKNIQIYIQDIFHVSEIAITNVSNVSYVKFNMTFS